jgi:hypothetical protein
VAALTAVVVAACFAVEIPSPAKPRIAADPLANSGGLLLVGVHSLVAAAFATLGALVVSHRPRNPIGWLLVLIGVSFAAIDLSNQVYLRVSLPQEVTPSGLQPVLWVGTWAYLPAFVSAIIFLPLLFPTGTPPSPRWKVLAWFVVAAGTLAFIGSAFAPGPLSGTPAVDNPVGIDSPLIELAGTIGGSALLPSALAAIGSLFLRFHRAGGVERQQLKWLAAAAALLPFGFASNFVVGDMAWPIMLVCLLVVAGAVATAMLRHRLYDIDVVINRTLVYGALTVMLAASYIGGVLLLQLLLRPWTERNDLAVAVSTLVVVALFGPARVRIQRVVDRRFYRARYDALRTVEEFGGRLRGSVDLGALDVDLRSVVHRTVQPTHVSVWLRTPTAGATAVTIPGRGGHTP